MKQRCFSIRPKRIRQQAGFTLVEMLIVMGLMSIFMVTMADIFVATAGSQRESEAYASVAHDGRYILARLTYDIQRSSSVTAPAALGGTGTSLALTIGGVVHQYSLSGGNLVIANPTSDRLNGSDTTVSAFTVQKLGNVGGKETVRFSFTVTSTVQKSGQGPETRTYTATAGRRQ